MQKENWDYRLSHKAVKNLQRLPQKDKERIIAAIEQMKNNPFFGDVKSIQGEMGLFRRRVGNYRIYFRLLKEKGFIDIPVIKRKQS